jgi:predicted MFS family arabinose efflux permease
MQVTPVRVGRAAGVAPAPHLILFACMFVGQAALIALSPVLPEVARDFDVSTATAGQLRAVSGLVAGGTAVGMGLIATRLGIRDLLILGLWLLIGGSLLSAAAPTFAVLAVAQVPVGAGLGIVLSAALAGAAEWVPDERRAGALSWTLIGPPAAWMVGLPVIGLVGQVSWRLGWIAVPVVAGIVALAAVVTRCPDEPVQRTRGALAHNRDLRRWGLGELLALSAWTGTVVYVGALLVESYDISVAAAGLLLGAGAAAYLPGTFIARRFAASPRRLLVGLALALTAGVAVFGAWRPALWVSALLFALLAFLAGGRTFAGSAAGLVVAPADKLLAMRMRAAALQFGYLVGSVVGGIALSAEGYGAMGFTFAVLFAAAAVVQHAIGRGD